DRNQRHGRQGRGIHRTDAALRHPRTGPHRADRDGSRRGRTERGGGRDVSAAPEKIVLPTRRLDPALVELLRSLKPGDTIRVVQTVRVGSRKWQSTTDGAFREIAYLETGITTERVKEDDLVVPVVRFTKPNGELSSISIDENTKVTKL